MFTLVKNMTGKQQVYNYQLICNAKAHGYDSLMVTIVLARNLEPLILETFLPTITLNCINQEKKTAATKK